MDSRDYICPFTIDCLSDVPADFEMPPGLSASTLGVFLPRSDPDWFGPSVHPAKVILLDRDQLFVVSHPNAKVPSVDRRLSELESVECGRILLLGWIQLRWQGAEQLLSYNRRSAGTVEKFLIRLRARWLFTRSNFERPHHFHFGDLPNDKFAHSISIEIPDEWERQVVRFHQPAVKITRRRIFKFETWCAGDLIVLTDRRFLLITEQRRSTYEPYGTVCRSSPLQMISGIRAAIADASPCVEIVLRSGETWRVAVHEGYERDAGAMAELAAKLLKHDCTNPRLPVMPQSALVEASGARNR
jgi:hypothetical protein